MAGAMRHSTAIMETRFTATGIDSVRSAAMQVTALAERASAKANAAAAGVQANLAKAAAASRVAAARMARELGKVDLLKARPGGADPFMLAQAEARAKEARNAYAKSRFAVKQASTKANAQAIAAEMATITAAERKRSESKKALWADYEAGKVAMSDLVAAEKALNASVDAVSDRAAVETARIQQVTAALQQKARAEDKAIVSSLRHASAEKIAADEEAARAGAIEKENRRKARQAGTFARVTGNRAALRDAGKRMRTAEILLGNNVLGTPSRVMKYVRAQGLLGLTLKSVGLGFGVIGFGLRAISSVAGFAFSALSGIGRLGLRAVGGVVEGVWDGVRAMTSFAASIVKTAALFPLRLGSALVKGVFSTLTHSLHGIERLLVRVALRAGALAAALHVLGGSALIKFSLTSADETATRGKDVLGKAVDHGLTTDQVQGIEGQAKRYGSDPATIFKHYDTFRELLAKAQANSQGTEAQTFKNFGLHVADIGGHNADPRTVFAEFAKEFGFATRERKSQLAQTFLGDQGAAVRDVRYYNALGGQGVNGLGDTSYARTTGTYLSPTDLYQLQAYQRQVTLVKDAWTGIKTSLTRAILPTMSKLADLASAFLVQYRETITGFLAGRVEAIARNIGAVAIIVQREIGLWQQSHRAMSSNADNIPILLKAYVIFDHYVRGPLSATLSFLWRSMKAIGTVIGNVAEDVQTLFSGPLERDLHYPWLQTLYDMGIKALSIIENVIEDVHTMYNGPLDKDLHYPWLQRLWDMGIKALSVIQSIGRDLWTLMTASSGSTYTIENGWLYVAWETAKRLGLALVWIGEVVANVVALLTGSQATSMPWLDTIYHAAVAAGEAVVAFGKDVVTVATGIGKIDVKDPLGKVMDSLLKNRSEIIQNVKENWLQIHAAMLGVGGGEHTATTVGGKFAEQVRDFVTLLIAAKDKIIEIWGEVSKVLSGGPGSRGQSDKDPWITSLIDGFDNVSAAAKTLYGWFKDLKDIASSIADPILGLFGTDLSQTLLFLTFAKFTGLLKAARFLGENLWGAGKSLLGTGAEAGAKVGSEGVAAVAEKAGVKGVAEIGAEGAAKVGAEGAAKVGLDGAAEGAGAGMLSRAGRRLLGAMPDAAKPWVKGAATALKAVAKPLAAYSIVDDSLTIGRDLGAIWDLRKGGASDQHDDAMTGLGQSQARSKERLEVPYQWLGQEQARAKEYASKVSSMQDIAGFRRAEEDYVRQDKGFADRMASFTLYFTPTDVVSGKARESQLEALRRSQNWSASPPTTAGGRS